MSSINKIDFGGQRDMRSAKALSSSLREKMTLDMY
jgi:hypothetical protein